MDKKEYFNKITANCSDAKMCTIRIMQARGFLMDEQNGDFYLSDNASSDDASYLNGLLKKYNLGKVDGTEYRIYHGRFNNNKKVIVPYTARIEVYDNVETNCAIEAFCDVERESYSVCPETKRWNVFRHRECGEKVNVKNLEPYVAYMVKALSACGVWTNFSCDGNHPDGFELCVGADYPFNIWAEFLYRYEPVLEKFRQLPTGIKFANNQFELYYQLFLAADYLYSNRLFFRDIKNDAIAFAKKRYRHKHTDNEIEEQFISNCNKLLKERRLTYGRNSENILCQSNKDCKK